MEEPIHTIHFKQCPICLGVGFLDDKENGPCPTCNADGEVPMTEEEEENQRHNEELDAGDQEHDLED